MALLFYYFTLTLVPLYNTKVISPLLWTVTFSTIVFLSNLLTDFVTIRSILPANASAIISLNHRGARRLCRKFLNQYAEGLKQASAKLKDRERNLKKYCNENNLKYKVDRTATPGYNKSVSSKTNSAYKQFVYDKYSSYIVSSVRSQILKRGIVPGLQFNKLKAHLLLQT